MFHAIFINKPVTNRNSFVIIVCELQPMQATNKENIMDFEVIREEYSSRGGGIEIDLTSFGYEDEKMTAYQNYLGGGMLGAIGNDCTISEWKEDEKLVEIADKLSRHFHTLTNHSDDEFESATFEENQKRPSSAY